MLAIGARNRDFLGEATLDNVLSVTGEAGDALNLALADGWTDAGAGPGAASGFTLFTVDDVTLAVENGVNGVTVVLA